MGQQLFLLHKPLIQPVSQGLCLHRNLFYWVHPEKKRDRQTKSEMKQTKKGPLSHSAETVCIYLLWKLQSRPRVVSCSPRAEQSSPNWSLLRQSDCVCCSFSLFWGFISWQAHQSVTGSAEGSPDRRQPSHEAPQNGYTCVES